MEDAPPIHEMTRAADETAVEAATRLARQLERHAERERMLRELAGSLAAAPDPEDLLRRVLAAVIDVSGARGALVDRVDPSGLHTHVIITRTADGIAEDASRDVAHEGWGVMGLAMSERAIVVTGDYLADDRFQHVQTSDELAASLGIRSVVAAPLIVNGEVLGVLAAYSDEAGAFDDEDAQVMGAFADHAAVAIATARRMDELDRSRRDLARRASEERALREIGASLAAIRRPDEVLAQAVRAACRLVGGEWAEISRLEPDLRMTWTHVHGLDDPDLRTLQDDLRLRRGEGILGKAVELRQAVVTGDYLADTSFVHLPKSDEFARLAGFRSLVAAPLIAGDEGVIGILAVHSSRPDAFDAGHVGLVDAFANMAAAAMGNARLIEELDRSEARYRYLVDNSPDVVFATDPEGIITYLSETSEPLLGWAAEDIVGKRFTALVHPTSLEYVERQYATSAAEPPAREVRYRFNGLHRDGSAVPLEMHARTIIQDGVRLGTHGACRDLRERERLERDLRRHAAELAASEERAHLARELHDSVTQALFSMTLVTKSIELLLDTDLDLARGRLQTLAELQADALAEMRALIFELRPASLEASGLAAALRTHCAAVQARTGLSVELDVEDEERLPGDVEAGLFRVAQEALNNVVKHATADTARVVLGRDAQTVFLEVADDGRGFDPERTPTGQMGLAGMRARVGKLGGRLEVSSAEGSGTRIRAEVPVPPATGAKGLATRAATVPGYARG